jgi:DNA-binding CsgD family transcriptional regulator
MDRHLRNELIASLAAADSVADLHEVACRICESCDLDHFLYATSVPVSFIAPKIIFISGYPQPWREHYNASGYASIDPTVHHSLHSVTPLSWTELAPLEAANPQVRTLMAESRDFGLVHGVTIPLHGSRGELAMLNFASSNPGPQQRESLEENLPSLHLLTTYFHENVRRVLDVITLPTSGGTLTARESECLLWAAEGKTSWETSQILGVSERTIIFHLQNAQEKLSACSRQHAVARAVATGVITPQIS